MTTSPDPEPSAEPPAEDPAGAPVDEGGANDTERRYGEDESPS